MEETILVRQFYVRLFPLPILDVEGDKRLCKTMCVPAWVWDAFSTRNCRLSSTIRSFGNFITLACNEVKEDAVNIRQRRKQSKDDLHY